MTVRVNKPAVNLREELASLRNQGGYSEQQFYFDSLVTNGTFDVDVSGWTHVPHGAGAVSWSSGTMSLDAVDASNRAKVWTSVSTEIGRKYTLVFTTTASISHFNIGTTAGGYQIKANSNISAGTYSNTFTATTTTTYLYHETWVTGGVLDNVSVFEVDANDDVIHTMPKGWVPKDVFEDGLLQREGAAHDYEVVYDGFDYKVKPTVAPTATTETCVIGVKA